VNIRQTDRIVHRESQTRWTLETLIGQFDLSGTPFRGFNILDHRH
jgi:hypothetical protein